MIQSYSEWTAILIVIFVGFLPTEFWRSMAVLAGRRLKEGSEMLLWVKAVATALLAAVVARLIFVPTGPLVDLPLWLRLACIVGGILGFLAIRRSVLAGVVIGEAILIGGAWWYAP